MMSLDKMEKSAVAAGALSVLMAGTIAWAEGWQAVENFMYDPGVEVVGKAGSGGFSGAWRQEPETFFDPEGTGRKTFFRTGDGPLSYPDLELPGTRLVFEGGGGRHGGKETARFERILRNLPDKLNEGRFVFSFVFRVADVKRTSYAGLQWLGEADSIRLHVGNSGELFLDGNGTGLRIQPGKTHLVCGWFEFEGDEGHARIKLWLDPVLESFGDPHFLGGLKKYGPLHGVSVEAQSFGTVEWDGIRIASAPEVW